MRRMERGPNTRENVGTLPIICNALRTWTILHRLHGRKLTEVRVRSISVAEVSGGGSIDTFA